MKRRRGATPLIDDRAVWLGLLQTARAQSARPKRDARELRRAANAAWTARMPSADPAVRAALVQFCRFAAGFELLSPDARADQAPELDRHIDVCAPAIEPGPARLPYGED